MGNIKNQAPILCNIGDRFPGGAYNAKTKSGDPFLMVSQTFYRIMNYYLNGHNGNEIKIMTVLMGTSPNFSVSEQWICELTSMAASSYRKSRDSLIKRQWLIHVPYKSLTINFRQMLVDGLKANISVSPEVAESYGISHDEYNEYLYGISLSCSTVEQIQSF